MSKEDLRVVKTLENIDNALIENLKKKHFNKITVDALCKTARINRTTFYKHYQDKYELLDKYIDKVLTEFKTNNEASFVDADPDSIGDYEYSRIFRESVDFLVSKKDTYEVLWTCKTDRDIFDEMVEACCDNIIRKELQKNPDIKNDSRQFFVISLFANLFSFNYLVSVRWWFANGDIMNRDDFYDMFDKMMKDGLFKTFKTRI